MEYEWNSLKKKSQNCKWNSRFSSKNIWNNKEKWIKINSSYWSKKKIETQILENKNKSWKSDSYWIWKQRSWGNCS